MEVMRVLQIVDSLTLGGAESVALNLANDLSEEPGYQSFLVCTREEGALNNRIKPAVTYLFLGKSTQLDVTAISKLYQFIKLHKINIVHAHSTSFYYPVLLKILLKYRIVWHDHYGMEILMNGKRSYPYIPFSRFFDVAISVNESLLASNVKHLHVKASNQYYIPNYSVSLITERQEPLQLIGVDKYRIVCLANIRPQKDHKNLVTAFKKVQEQIPQATLYCIGLCNGDKCEKELRQLIKDLNLQDSVILTGGVTNPFLYLKRSAVAVLSSLSEGLPLSLIEYGLASLPVVCTRVGQCETLLLNGQNGLLVPPASPSELANGILQLFNTPGLKEDLALSFNSFIRKHYSKTAILHQLKAIYQTHS